MSFLELKGLRKRYGAVAAVDGVDLGVAAAGRTAIVGPSGCGKTTLLRLIAGFETPDDGEIAVDGKVLADGAGCEPAYRRNIGVVAQDGALFPHLTIAENIGFGIDRNEAGRADRIAGLAYVVGLDSTILRRRPHQLSGGQQQRVALARAMARKPQLMLLDEPFSALDTGLRVSMRKAVAELLESEGIATILVTHDQSEALSFADQVVVMREGKFSQVGDPRDLYFQPKDRMVAEFLGDAIIVPARVAGGWAVCRFGRIAVRTMERREVGRIMLRPEQIVFGPVAGEETGMAGRLPAPPPGAVQSLAEVVSSQFSGTVCTVELRLLNSQESPETAAIGEAPLIVRRSAIDMPTVGSTVSIALVGHAHLFG